VLTLALVVEVAEIHRVGGLVGLVGGAAGLVLLLSAPLTLCQFSALLVLTVFPLCMLTIWRS
jgi:hypothetical protein